MGSEYLSRRAGGKSGARTSPTSPVRRSVVDADDGECERRAQAAADRIISLHRSALDVDCPAGHEQSVSRLQVGAADDVHEREAEATADRVMRSLAASGQLGAVEPSTTIHRSASEVGAAGGPVSDGVAGRIESARGGGSPLPGDIRRTMETAFGGANFGGVRIHAGAESASLNRSVAARAFTVGQDIFLGSSTPALGSAPGQRLLAHELAHTQSSSGVVRRVEDGTEDANHTSANDNQQAPLVEGSQQAPSTNRADAVRLLSQLAVPRVGPSPDYSAQVKILKLLKTIKAEAVLGTLELTTQASLERPGSQRLQRRGSEAYSNTRGVEKDFAVDKKELNQLVSKLVIDTMEQAGHFAYLRKAGIFGEQLDGTSRWMVSVEVHYVANRGTSQMQLHKDTRGHTVFATLNYFNASPIFGPEYLPAKEPVHELDSQLSRQHPDYWGDIAQVRNSMESVDEIDFTVIPPFGYAAVADELVYHKTPDVAGRAIKWEDYESYLKAEITKAEIEKSSSNFVKALEKLKESPSRKKATLHWEADPNRQGKGEKFFNRSNLRAGGFSDQLITELFTHVRGSKTTAYVNVPAQGAVTQDFDHGHHALERKMSEIFHSVDQLEKPESLSEPTPTRWEAFKARLGYPAECKITRTNAETYREALSENTSQPRSFLRTWVRIVEAKQSIEPSESLGSSSSSSKT